MEQMSKPLTYRKKPVVIEVMRFYADELPTIKSTIAAALGIEAP